eukprot:GHVU01116265.1.p1 GENE.GHVU01116265.1~~GHVU01116265.1.p1  ORF type:complete len:491 (-),score=83.33 GHVU01116265.1:369-1841(-)
MRQSSSHLLRYLSSPLGGVWLLSVLFVVASSSARGSSYAPRRPLAWQHAASSPAAATAARRHGNLLGLLSKGARRGSFPTAETGDGVGGTLGGRRDPRVLRSVSSSHRSSRHGNIAGYLPPFRSYYYYAPSRMSSSVDPQTDDVPQCQGETAENLKEGNDDGEGKLLLLSRPRGFCEGVNRAVRTVEETLRLYGSPVYVKHAIVHNRIVCDRLKEKGAIFVEDIEEIPRGATVVFSAHGVSPAVREAADARQLRTIDASCPLVSKVHVYVKKKAEEGYSIILIGHKTHVEIVGVQGEAPEATTVVESAEDVARLPFDADAKLFYATQTTLSVDDYKDILAALKSRYPNIASIPSGSICYATTNRQGALKHLVEKWPDQVQLALVVGDPTSSNSQRLKETAAHRGVPARLVTSEDQIDPEWLRGIRVLCLTSGASTPEDVVQRVIGRLRELGVARVEEFVHAEETVRWKLPRNLETAIKERETERERSSDP